MSELTNWIVNIGQEGYKTIFEDCGIDINKTTSSGEWSVKCPFHEDKHASMSINRKNGLYKCMVSSCQAFNGGNVLSFLKLNKNFKTQESIDYISKLLNIEPPKYTIKKENIISNNIVEKYHQDLLNNPQAKKALMEQRGFTEETINRFKLGYENKIGRYTIPVYNEHGKTVNIRRYKMNADSRKMLSYVDEGGNRLYGAIRLFNIKNLLKNKEVIFTEAETDSMLLDQFGFNSFTVTSGAGTFNAEWIPLFKDKIVHIVFDLDIAGKTGALKIANILNKVCEKVYIVTLPDTLGEHGDVTDFFVSLDYGIDEFRKLLNVTPVWIPEEDEEEVAIETSLGKASQASNFGKKLKFPILISGKDTAPYLVPGHFTLYCDRGAGKICASCPLSLAHGEKIIKLSAKDAEVLELIDCPKDQQVIAMKRMSGNFKNCPRIKIDIQEYINVEQIRMIPKVSFSTEENEYVARAGYYIGHGIKTNRYYHIMGYTFPEPKKEYATHIFSEIESAQDDIESFKLTDELKKEFKLFQPSHEESIADKLYDIANDFENNVTMIYERKDMQIAMDLIYHSCLNFKFQNRAVKKGWLTGLILGDTGSGKTLMVTRLIEHYKLGDRICAEGATLAGLIGALSQVANKWQLSWGKLPLSDRRILVIDEMSGLKPEVIEKLTDCLSTGVAAITKVITEETNARARIIFLTNPKEGRPLNAYQGGIVALKSVIPKMEDIRRLDFAMTVAKHEVSPNIINTKHIVDGKPKYTSDLCHSLVLWCWSRKIDDIIIEEDAQDTILETAMFLSEKYSSQIPLVEAADQRFKIARMAVACAGRLYSTDADGEKVIVKTEHVYFVRSFLDFIYSKSSMAYDVFSRAVKKRTEINDSEKEDLIEVFLALPQKMELITFLMENNFFKKIDMIDQIGYDYEEARKVWRFLSKNYLITLHGKFGYTKEPNLILILKELEQAKDIGHAKLQS